MSIHENIDIRGMKDLLDQLISSSDIELLLTICTCMYMQVIFQTIFKSKDAFPGIQFKFSF